MTPDMPIGRIMNLDEAVEFWNRISQLEKAFGEKLTKEEKIVVLKNFGKEITNDELRTLLEEKRALIIKGSKDA